MSEPVKIGAVWGELERLTNTRSCEGCDLCCTATSVEPLHKPPGVRCRHLTALQRPGHNCMIYDRRPGVCASFQCLWRVSDSTLSGDFFPADCGFCLWLNDPFVWPMVITVGVDPARPDAWDRPQYRAKFSELAYDLNCLVAIGEGMLAEAVFAPSGKVFLKQTRAEFFRGGKVGVWSKEFRPGVRLTVAEIAQKILGYGPATGPTG